MTLSIIVNKYKWHLLYVVLFFSYILPKPVISQEKANYFSVLSENDIYAPDGQDRHYTNGLRFSFGFLSNSAHSWYTFMDRLIGNKNSETQKHYEVAFGQNIYTPENFLNPDPILNDRPFAGWLYGEVTTVSYLPGSEKSLTTNLGIIGPMAKGEEIQKINHSIINDPKPEGWDNQLKNEPAILIKYRQSWFIPVSQSKFISTGRIARGGINLGNVFTDAGVGLVFRLGNYRSGRELPNRIQPGLSGNLTSYEARKNQTDWQIFAEIQGRGIARNIFLDGNSFRNSQSVNKKHFVYDLGAGLVIGFGQFNYPILVSFSIVWRSKEFDVQRGMNSFGSAMIGVQY